MRNIRKFIHELRNHKEEKSLTFAGILSGPVSSRSNESRHITESIKLAQHSNNRSSRHHLSYGQTPANLVPASINLPKNRTRAARLVSNDDRLALNARQDPGPASPALPADTAH